MALLVCSPGQATLVAPRARRVRRPLRPIRLPVPGGAGLLPWHRAWAAGPMALVWRLSALALALGGAGAVVAPLERHPAPGLLVGGLAILALGAWNVTALYGVARRQAVFIRLGRAETPAALLALLPRAILPEVLLVAVVGLVAGLAVRAWPLWAVGVTLLAVGVMGRGDLRVTAGEIADLVGPVLATAELSGGWYTLAATGGRFRCRVQRLIAVAPRTAAQVLGAATLTQLGALTSDDLVPLFTGDDPAVAEAALLAAAAVRPTR